MKILFTGASSFTGLWFVRELAAAGHEVFATFRGDPESYAQSLRGSRLTVLEEVCTPVFDCTFGSPRMLDLIAGEQQWDLLCHHAAEVTDYQSPNFNIVQAIESNTLNIRTILTEMSARGCQRLLSTGSVFEANEGAGSDGLPSFSPYGVSKSLSAQLLAYHACEAALHFGKFVIPNPFGPFEEPRFTAYLMKTWSSGETAEVRTPDYVRDNIHVDLLAAVYRQFAEHLPTGPGSSKINPSGYIESQGQFAQRYARHMRERTGLACDLTFATQTDFAEPRVRINLDPAKALIGEWDETAAWDAVAAYAQSAHVSQ